MPGMSKLSRVFALLPTLFLLQLACAFARADEVVTFKSARYLVGELQQRLARERGEMPVSAPADKIIGYLSRPPGDGPFPAIVHVHGCGGLSEQRRIADADQFTRWGYVTLIVDSFTTRGIKDSCSAGTIAPRQADALGALVYLSKLPYIDPGRIAIVGYSQGGIAALHIASAQPIKIFDVPDGLAFRAVVAYYPDCGAASNRLAIPTLVLIGELDDWSWASSCERLMKRWDPAGAPLKVIVFPDAYHSFDSVALGRNTVRYYGHWLRYDENATQRAALEMHDFLAAQLAK